MPPDDELARLAAAYLNRARQLWPKLARGGLLPKPTDAVVKGLIDDFKHRHRTGNVSTPLLDDYAAARLKLAGVYARFSCDNSDPTSIIDQVVKCLEKAKELGLFCPWCFVFGDYSISGLDSARQGYSSYKKVLNSDSFRIEATIIDDFTRASRDELEWWRLAQLSKKLNRELVGAFDGFCLSDPNSDVLITMFGLVSRLFVKGLREKVRRGMSGAAERGTNLGKLALGLTRRPVVDDAGQVVTRSNGKPKTEPCIDDATKDDALRMFNWFTREHWTSYRIAREFNRRQVDGWNGWMDRTIKKLLGNPVYIGVFIWNKYRSEYDPDKQRSVRLKNPPSEWKVRYDPDLALIPMETWRAARRRLSEMRRNSPLTGRVPSRNQVSASTLFSGTLYCGYCGRELLLSRSAGKYKSMGCIHGAHRAHGCELTTSKSTRIIETCLLGHIRDAVLTDDTIEQLVVKANEYLAEEAKLPRTDTRRMKAQAKRLSNKIKKLVKRVERSDDELLCEGYENRIKELQAELIKIRGDIREAEVQNADLPPPLDVAEVRSMLGDLRELLNQETPAAAAAIRALTGPIHIRQEIVPGRRRGARWIATFQPNVLSALRGVAREQDYPDSVTLEYLSARNWITLDSAQVVIEQIPKYERLAPEFLRLHQAGNSVQTIAAAHGMSWQQAGVILQFAMTGERPRWPNHRRSGNGPASEPLYQRVAEDVARLREQERLSFPRIKTWLAENRDIDVSLHTIRRAYDHARPEVSRQAAVEGETPRRGSYSHLGETVYREIRQRLRAGQTVRQIAEAIGCRECTVRREKHRME